MTYHRSGFLWLVSIFRFGVATIRLVAPLLKLDIRILTSARRSRRAVITSEQAEGFRSVSHWLSLDYAGQSSMCTRCRWAFVSSDGNNAGTKFSYAVQKTRPDVIFASPVPWLRGDRGGCRPPKHGLSGRNWTARYADSPRRCHQCCLRQRQAPPRYGGPRVGRLRPELAGTTGRSRGVSKGPRPIHGGRQWPVHR